MPDLDPQDAADLAVVRELIAAEQAGERYRVPVGPYTAYLLVSACQLTVTHPSLSPKLRQAYEQAGRRLQAAFFGFPAYEVLEKGWHRDHDRPREEE